MRHLAAADPEAAGLLAELQSIKAALLRNEPTVAVPETREFYWSKIERQIQREAARPFPARGPGRSGSGAGWPRWLGAAALAAVLLLALNQSTPRNALNQVSDTADGFSARTFRDQSVRHQLCRFPGNRANAERRRPAPRRTRNDGSSFMIEVGMSQPVQSPLARVAGGPCPAPRGPGADLAALARPRRRDLNLEAKLIWGANDGPARMIFCRPALARHPPPQQLQVDQLLPNHQPRRRDPAQPEPRRANERPLHPEHQESRLIPVAVDCIGQGKQISKGTNTLPLIWAADDTNNTVWFVCLQDLGAAGGNLVGQRGRNSLDYHFALAISTA